MVVAYQAPGDSDRVPSAPGARAMVERLVRLNEHQDLAGVARVYASDATRQVHIPSWDGRVTGPTAIRELQENVFGREELRVDRHQSVEEADHVGLGSDLSWRDATTARGASPSRATSSRWPGSFSATVACTAAGCAPSTRETGSGPTEG